jgi:hypothetical protein
MEPSKDWKEKIEPREEARFEKLAHELHQVQRATDRMLHEGLWRRRRTRNRA